MKKVAVTLLVFLLICFYNNCYSQDGGPPDPPSDHGANGDQTSGGEAPIGEGTMFLFGLAGAYIVKKYHTQKSLNKSS